MAMYGGDTPKRHVPFSNSYSIEQLNRGKLEGWSKRVRDMEAAGGEKTKTVVKYIDKSGRSRFKGTPSLKATESET